MSIDVQRKHRQRDGYRGCPVAGNSYRYDRLPLRPEQGPFRDDHKTGLSFENGKQVSK